MKTGHMQQADRSPWADMAMRDPSSTGLLSSAGCRACSYCRHDGGPKQRRAREPWVGDAQAHSWLKSNGQRKTPPEIVS